MTAAAGAPGARRSETARKGGAPARKAQTRPELRLVTGRRRRRRQVVALTLVGMVALLSTQKRIDDLDAQIATQRDWNAKARLRIDTLSSPEVIVAGAKDLGMVEPERPVYLVPSASLEREIIESTHEALNRPSGTP